MSAPSRELASSKPSVCVINYNGASYLERSLRALMDIEESLAEVLVVDNASTDESRTLIEERFPGVRLLAMPENLGAAAARNVALAHARTDPVVLIDNDVTLTPGSLAPLLEVFHHDAAVVAAMPAIVLEGPRRIVQYDGADTHYLGHQTLHHERMPYDSLPTEERDLGSVVSACLAVHRARLPGFRSGGDAVAPFDEDFFIYFEDHDFGYRMRTLGLRIRAVPTAWCLHAEGTTGLSIRALGSYSPLRVYLHIRNRWIFIIKNYSGRTLALLAPMLLGYEVVQLIGVTRRGWLGQYGRAAWWIVSHPRKLYAKRRQIQGSRRMADGALLSGGVVPLRKEATSAAVERVGKKVLDSMADAYWRVARRLL